ncbi:MAG: hypothetical protein WCP34_11885 [Pseudomonadota bacterium]
MMKSYEAIYNHGIIEWVNAPPPVQHFRMVIVVEQPESTVPSTVRKPRVPPPELKGSVKWLGDPFEPVISEEEWEASLDRTARQIAGDLEAFK